MLPPDIDDLMRNAGVDVDYPSDKFEAWLQKLGFEGSEAYLAGCVFPKRSVEVYPYYFSTEAKVRQMNGARSGTPKPLLEGLLLIGTTSNGDFLAVDLHGEHHVGIICHEQVVGEEPARDYFATIADTMGDLAVMIDKVKAPGDYNEALNVHRRRQRSKPRGQKKKK